MVRPTKDKNMYMQIIDLEDTNIKSNETANFWYNSIKKFGKYDHIIKINDTNRFWKMPCLVYNFITKLLKIALYYSTLIM